MTENLSIWRRQAPQWVSSALLGFFSVSLLTFQGFACPLFEDMFHDFGIQMRGWLRLLTMVRWWWTLPVGIVSAALLIWKATVLPLPKNKKIDFLVLVALLAQASVWIWKVFSVTMPSE